MHSALQAVLLESPSSVQKAYDRALNTETFSYWSCLSGHHQEADAVL